MKMDLTIGFFVVAVPVLILAALIKAGNIIGDRYYDKNFKRFEKK
jgi:hypothetical protein